MCNVPGRQPGEWHADLKTAASRSHDVVCVFERRVQYVQRLKNVDVIVLYMHSAPHSGHGSATYWSLQVL